MCRWARLIDSAIPNFQYEPDTTAMTRIQIYDTTLRDGSQGEGVNFSLQDKLMITAKLDELGFDYIEGGYPLSNPKDEEYFQRAADLDLKRPVLACAWRHCGAGRKGGRVGREVPPNCPDR